MHISHVFSLDPIPFRIKAQFLPISVIDSGGEDMVYDFYSVVYIYI